MRPTHMSMMHFTLPKAAFVMFLGLLSLVLLTPAARAENFGDKFARCMVNEEKEPNYKKATAWEKCERKAQVERDAELSRTEDTGPNMKLLKPTLAFHWCVEKQTGTAIATIKSGKFSNARDAEGWAWNQVLDKCFPVLIADENQGMIYQNYQGNNQRMTDFRDGLLWSARAFVFSAVAEWSNSKR